MGNLLLLLATLSLSSAHARSILSSEPLARWDSWSGGTHGALSPPPTCLPNGSFCFTDSACCSHLCDNFWCVEPRPGRAQRDMHAMLASCLPRAQLPHIRQTQAHLRDCEHAAAPAEPASAEPAAAQPEPATATEPVSAASTEPQPAAAAKPAASTEPQPATASEPQLAAASESYSASSSERAFS